MLEYLNGLQMLVIGMTTGVIGSFLIFATYKIMGRAAAEARVAEFFDLYGIRKGLEHYKEIVDTIKDDALRAEYVAEVDRYATMIRDEEKVLDAIVARNIPANK